MFDELLNEITHGINEKDRLGEGEAKHDMEISRAAAGIMTDLKNTLKKSIKGLGTKFNKDDVKEIIDTVGENLHDMGIDAIS